MAKALTVREEQFCLLYSKTGNATQSYKHAGYTCKNDNVAAVMGIKLLKKVKIANRLKEMAAEKQAKEICGADEMQKALTEIIRDSGARPQDKTRAIELLAKMQGALLPRTTENDVQITVNLGDFG